MPFQQRSLGEDSTDRYVHTWTVSLLFFPSLVTWLLAASPLVISSGEGTPPFQAKCWCPAQFESSQVEYSNAFCSTWYSDAFKRGTLRGLRDLLTSLVSFKPEDSSILDYYVTTNGSETFNLDSSDQYFASVTAPLVLFIFALLIKLPHLVWYLMSTFCPVNIEKTLHTADHAQNLQTDTKRQVTTDLVQSVDKALKDCPHRATVSYLFCKFFSSLVLVLESIVLSTRILPQVFAETGSRQPIQQQSEVLPCYFTIRQLSNHHDYFPQCLFSPTDTSRHSQLGHHALFTGLLAYFLILTVVSVVSFLTWLSGLTMGTCRSQVAARPSLPTDAYLLLYLSQDNLGPMVTRDLAENEAWTQDSGLAGPIVDSGQFELDGQRDGAEEGDQAGEGGGGEGAEEKMDSEKEKDEKKDDMTVDLDKVDLA
nr:innexin-7 [Aplysia californica]